MPVTELARSIDWPVLAAWIAAIAAISVPFFASIIQSRNQVRLKELEIMRVKRLDAYEKYFRFALNAMVAGEPSDGHYTAVTAMFLYAPKDVHAQILEMDSRIQKSKGNPDAGYLMQSRSLLSDIAQKLSL